MPSSALVVAGMATAAQKTGNPRFGGKQEKAQFLPHPDEYRHRAVQLPYTLSMGDLIVVSGENFGERQRRHFCQSPCRIHTPSD